MTSALERTSNNITKGLDTTLAFHTLPMFNSSYDLKKPSLLRKRLRDKGYLFFKGFFLNENFDAIKREINQTLANSCFHLNSCSAQMTQMFFNEKQELVLGSQMNWPIHYHQLSLKHMLYLSMILNSKQLFELFHNIMELPVTKGAQEVKITPSGRSLALDSNLLENQNAYVVWLPFQSITLEQGGLVVCERSHLFETQTLKKVSFTEQHPLSLMQAADFSNKYECQFVNESFEAGDIVILSTRVIHGSLNNNTADSTLSCSSVFHPVQEEIKGEECLENIA